MNPKESQSLQDFLNQLVQVRGVNKDPQADAMIATAIAQQPDAAYLLVQRSLLLDQALAGANSQIAALQNQIQSLQTAAPQSSRGFLDANAWGNASAPAARPAPAPFMAAAPAPMAAAPVQYQAAPAAPGFFGSGLGSTLGTVAATAAGVAGGAFLFQGIEHLMNSGSGASMMHPGGMGMGAPVENVENTTINNYYSSDTDNRDSDRSRDDRSADNDSVDYADNSDSGGYDDSMI